MNTRLIIGEDSVYEIDEQCMRRKYGAEDRKREKYGPDPEKTEDQRAENRRAGRTADTRG